MLADSANISRDDTHSSYTQTHCACSRASCRNVSADSELQAERLFTGSPLAPDWLWPVLRQRGGTAAEAERPLGPDSCVCPQ